MRYRSARSETPMERRSRRDRSDRSGRVALLGCGGGVLLLLGITALGVFGYAAGVIAVHMLPGYTAAVDAIETREVEEPLLGAPVSMGVWLGLQLGRDEEARLELRIRSSAVGSRTSGTVYTTLQDVQGTLTPTTVLLDVNGTVVDILADNAAAEEREAIEQRETLVEEARRLVARGQPAQALPFADEAVILDPRNADAYAVRADIRRLLDDLPGAEADAREALGIAPTHPEGRRALAQVQRAREDWQSCIDTATECIRDEPRDGEAWTIRAFCFAGAEMPRKALAGAREGCNLGDPEGCALASTLE